MKRRVKLLASLMLRLADASAGAGCRVLGRSAAPQLVVLYYHAVKSHQRAAFGRQMDLLLRLAKPWRLDRQGEAASGRFAAVTFDDGYASVVENALPELKRRNIPFTVFFPTGSWNQRPRWISNPRHSFWEERVLSRDELRSLAAEPLATIASHSVNHPNFLTLGPEAAAREFVESRRTLEELLDRPVDLFSFPHGAHNPALVRQALDSGYRRLFTIEPVPASVPDPGLVVGRVAVEPDDWPIETKAKLLGAYRWMARRDRTAASGLDAKVRAGSQNADSRASTKFVS